MAFDNADPRPMNRLLREFGPIVLLLLAALLPYRDAGQNGFVYDDIAIVQNNPRVQDLSRAAELFRTEYWNDPNIPSRLYRPVTLLSYAVERRFLGPSPGHFHQVNVALHALVVLLAYFCFLRLLGPTSYASASLKVQAALAAAVVFAVHPLNSEAVAGIVGRAELLAACFALGAWILLLRQGTGRLAVPILSTAAFLSKESAVLLVPIVFLSSVFGVAPGTNTALWSRARAGGRTLLWILPGFALAWAARSIALHDIPQPSIDPDDNVLAGASISARLATAFGIFGRYFGHYVWPVHLSPDYSVRATEILGFGNISALLGLVAYLGFLLGAIWLLRRKSPGSSIRSVLGFAAAWYLTGMTMIGNFIILIGTSMADRLTYLPGVGLALLIASVILQGLRAGRGSDRMGLRRLLLGLGVVLYVCLVIGAAAITTKRTHAWQSPHTLFEQATIDQPKSFRVWSVFGELLLKEGDIAGARDALLRAQELNPQNEVVMGYLLAAQLTLGEDAGAEITVRSLQQARPTDARPLCVRALLEARKGSLEEARRSAEAALALDPSTRSVRYILDRIAERAGNPNVARLHFPQALHDRAETTQALRELGPLLVKLALWPEAAGVYRELFLTQRDWGTANALAWTLVNDARRSGHAGADELVEALAAAEFALQSVPASSRKYVLDTLAAVQWESGDRESALQTMERLQREFPWEDSYRRKLQAARQRLDP